MKQSYRLVNNFVKNNLIKFLDTLPLSNESPYVVEIKEEKRTNRQNNLMWAMLTDISNQVVWHGNRLTPEEWKHLITASIKGQKAVKGLDGKIVFMGLSTSKMTKKEMAEVITTAEVFGLENNVKFGLMAIEAIEFANGYKNK